MKISPIQLWITIFLNKSGNDEISLAEARDRLLGSNAPGRDDYRLEHGL
jgi:hypothetical protein